MKKKALKTGNCDLFSRNQSLVEKKQLFEIRYYIRRIQWLIPAEWQKIQSENFAYSSQTDFM